MEANDSKYDNLELQTFSSVDKKSLEEKFTFSSARSVFNYGGETTNEDTFEKWGDDNQLPKHLINLQHGCALHGACLASKYDAIIGNGLINKQNGDTFSELANPVDTWNEVFQRASYDFNLLGLFALEIEWAPNGKNFYVYHVDASMVRAKKMKDNERECQGYYICRDWKQDTNIEEMPFLPKFNPATAKKDKRQIMVYTPYRTSLDYYSHPHYVGGLKDIEILSEVASFHINNLRNGLTQNVAITTFMKNANQDQLKQLQRNFKLNYTGVRNAGGAIFQNVPHPDLKPVIEAIPQNLDSEYFTDLNEVHAQNVLSAHQITSPTILGIQTAGKLGQSQEMIDAYSLFQNIVILPLQAQILDCFNKLTRIAYDVELQVATKVVLGGGETGTKMVEGNDDNDGEEIKQTTENQTT